MTARFQSFERSLFAAVAAVAFAGMMVCAAVPVTPIA
jgi:hypothetical protein